MEAAMMNLGVVLPEPGYLEACARSRRSTTSCLIFDEVKTGLAIAAGGASERFGVQPDMVTLAKTLGAGLPSGAIGATDEVMSVVESETVFQVGHVQREPADDGGRARRAPRGADPRCVPSISTGSTTASSPAVRRSSSATACPAYTVGISSKGCVVFSDTKIVDYETFMTTAGRRGHGGSPGCTT
jgi:glutamate-1-semialdehyde 2,1-aminomutase